MKQRNAKSLIEVLPNAAEIPLLTVEEELVLVAQIKKGDADAAEKLKFHNLRFVACVAKQYLNEGLTMEQLIEEGNHGLVTAAKKFSEKCGLKFMRFAVWEIRRSILEALIDKLEGVEGNQLNSREQFILQHTDEEAVAELEISPRRVLQIRERALRKLNH